MVRIALMALSVAVVVAAAGAVVQASQPRPVGVEHAVVAGSPDPMEPTGAVHTAGDAAAADVGAGPTTFTLAELHQGEVSATRFAAFWDAELERIRTAPCPAPVMPGSTVVVATVGATPPADLGEDYTDYAPLIADARAAAAAACA